MMLDLIRLAVTTSGMLEDLCTKDAQYNLHVFNIFMLQIKQQHPNPKPNLKESSPKNKEMVISLSQLERKDGSLLS